MKPYKARKSKIDNFGLYATKNIKKGSKIIEYKGKVITRREAEDNPKYDNDKAIYLFNLNKRYDLDGDFKFNTARLINHSCDPNCEVTGTGLKVWVHAIKDINKGEEFSYDYGFSFGEDYKNYPSILDAKTLKNKHILNDKNIGKIKMPNVEGFLLPDPRPDIANLNGKPCMKNCVSPTKIIGKARDIDVTPEDEKS